MNDGGDFIPGREYVAVKPPFARRTAASEPAAAKVHERNVVGLEGVIWNSARTHEKTPFIPAYADIAGCSMSQAALRECATGGNYRAGLPSGTTLTVSSEPEEVRPVTCVSSVGDRSSIGISRPDPKDQSMVLSGSAA